MFPEEHHIFLLKRFCPVMLRLIGNIFFYRAAIGHAYRKGAVTRLPCEIFYTDAFVNPARRSLLDVLYECRQRVSRPQTDQQMNMIRSSPNRFRNPIRCADQTSQIFVQTRTPCVGDKGMPILRAEDNVEMQAQVRGRPALKFAR